MTAYVGWTQQTVDALSATEAAKLRADLSSQSMSRDAGQRRDAFQLLQMLGARKDGARPVQDRAADARAFLHPTDTAAAARAWEVACELHGGAKQAERKGYRPPGEAA